MLDPQDALREAMSRAAQGPPAEPSLDDIHRRVARRRGRTATMSLTVVALVAAGLAAGSLRGSPPATSDVAVGGSTPPTGPYYPRVGGECITRSGLQSDIRADVAQTAAKSMQLLYTPEGYAGPLALVERLYPAEKDRGGVTASPKVDLSPENGRGRAEWHLSDGSKGVLSTQQMSRQTVEDLAASLKPETSYTPGFHFEPRTGLPPFSVVPVNPGQVVGTLASAVCTRPDGTATVIGAVSGPVPDRYAGFLATGAPLAAREIDGADVLVITTTGQAQSDLDMAGKATPEQWAMELDRPGDVAPPGPTPATAPPTTPTAQP